jgi:CheY-like chemotaxis protein
VRQRTDAAGRAGHLAVVRGSSVILVVDDVEETRDGTLDLLRTDGYGVEGARSEDDAVERARRVYPDLILVSFGGPPTRVVASAARIRRRSGLGERVPVVVFCVPTLEEGEEVALGGNVHATRPDNFNQLRTFIRQLLGA